MAKVWRNEARARDRKVAAGIVQIPGIGIR